MARLEADKYNYDWTRENCYIEFFYKGQCFRFENSLKKAQAEGNKVYFVADLFAQLVLSLESLAHIICDFKVYDLTTWAQGMKALPAPKEIPRCFITLGFTEIPDDEEVKKRFREFSKLYHPDNGGDPERFMLYVSAKNECLKFIENRK